MTTKKEQPQVVGNTAVEVEENQLAIVENAPENMAISTVNASGEMTLADTFENTAAIFYSSIVNDGTRESSIKIYNAMNNAAMSIRDIQASGHTIKVTDIIAHQIQLLDEQTGEVVEATRVVLIDENGAGYHAVANGIVSSIQKIVAIVGRAPWNPGLEMKPRLVKTRKGFYTLTIELV